MARPGTSVTLQDTPPPISVVQDTTTWFATGMTQKGPLSAVLVTSISEFESVFGTRQSYSMLWDALDVFFREGGSSAYISRVVGPAATIGTLALKDSGAANSLTVSALGPGSYSSGLSIQVVAGTVSGSYQLIVLDNTVTPNVILEQSPNLLSQMDAVNWSKSSKNIRIALAVSANNPAVAAAAPLSAGADDRSSITDADRKTALDRFTQDLGPGQVSSPGNTSDTVHTDLLDHAFNNTRVALLDLPDTNNATTLKTSVTNARVGNQRWGASFAPWFIVPGVAAGTTRTIPPSCIVAGLIARNEPGLGPNQPSAGRYGLVRYALDLSQVPWTDAQREDLSDNGVNVSITSPAGGGNIMVYGWRSLTDAVADPSWIDFANVRLFMAIGADADAIAGEYLFRMIDGQGQTISDFTGALTGMLLDWYNSGALYGANSSDAFTVDTGAQVNTPQTLAANELHAIIYVRMSPFAEFVAIEIVKQPITQTITGAAATVGT
jgi:phage tail sheath protein FI